MILVDDYSVVVVAMVVSHDSRCNASSEPHMAFFVFGKVAKKKRSPRARQVWPGANKVDQRRGFAAKNCPKD